MRCNFLTTGLAKKQKGERGESEKQLANKKDARADNPMCILDNKRGTERERERVARLASIISVPRARAQRDVTEIGP